MASILTHPINQSPSREQTRSPWRRVLSLVAGSVSLMLLLSVTAAQAAVSDRLLPSLLQQLKDQGKKIKTTSVTEITDGEAVVTITLATGEIRKYDTKGRLKEIKHPDGKITKYKNGMPVVELDVDGSLISRTEYFRSKSGKLRKVVKTGRNGIETKSFDGDGNVVQVTNAQGTKFYSNYVKNEKGKTVSYVERDLNTGKVKQVLQDPKSGAVIAKIDANGVRTDIEQQHDASGTLVGVIERTSTGKVKVKKFKKGQLVEVIEDGIRTVHENVMNEKGQLVQKTERKLIPSAGGVVEDVTIKDYDANGRVLRKQDKTGEHTYEYVVDDNGRIKSRFETIRGVGDAGLTRKKVSHYDEAGRVIGVEEEGENTNTNYVLDESGNITSSVDTITITLGMQSFSQQIKKEYDDQGRIIAKTDGNGLRTEYTYDARGNRTGSRNEYETIEYTYDEHGNLTESVRTDHKSVTLSEFDIKTKLANLKVKIKNSGIVEVTTFGLDGEGKRVSYTLEAFGIRVTTFRDATSEQPEQVVFTKYNGKQTVTNYEYSGNHLILSKEAGPSGTSETRYNALGKAFYVLQADQWGRTQEITHQYARGRMALSLTVDKKGKTVTEYNKFEDPVKITRVNTIGFPRKSVEERMYKHGILMETVSKDVKGKSITSYDAHEMAEVVHRVNKHGFPRENWVTNNYNASGELDQSFQTDNRGFTVNNYDGDGLMEDSTRTDIYGFPKRKYTTYQYKGGELMTSITDDQRGTSYNTFDVDSLMRETHRVKKFGYPREEFSTFDYDSNGYMTYSETQDENGFTQNYYNIDEVVVVAYRENKYGHAREQWTTNEYNDQGFLMVSKQTDLKGATITDFDLDGLAIHSMRYDHYGVEFGRDSLSFNEYDFEGFMTTTLTKNLLSNMEKIFDRDSLVQEQIQRDNFGVLDSRNKESHDFEYDHHGRMQTNITTDQLGTSYSTYDIHGDATTTRRVANIGLEASRDSFTQAVYHADTGMTTDRVSRNLYGTTYSLDFDAITGLESQQFTANQFGLLATRETDTRLELDKRHGLTRQTLAVNAYGKTLTHFDTEDGGPYGVAKISRSINNFGLGYTQDTETAIDADIHTGQNLRTKALNKYGLTITDFDTLDGGSYGVATRSYSKNNFGLIATEETITAIEANTFNGLNEVTVAGNAYGTTVTFFEAERTGVALESVARNNFGLGKTLNTHTTITANIFNGLNQETLADNEYGATLTRYDDQKFGVAEESDAKNNYGLEASRQTHTVIAANTNNGLNQETTATNDYSVSTTWFDDEQYGTAEESVTRNNFGLGASRITRTKIYANEFNGLNQRTIAENAYGITSTLYDDQESGVAEESLSHNYFGLGASRDTHTLIDADRETGLNDETLGTSAYGTTRTFYDDEFGVSVLSRALNNFGLGATLENETFITANTFNGLNKLTVAQSAYSTTTTEYDDREYGVSLRSDGLNNYGLIANQATHTEVNANTWNGLNRSTVAENLYGTTTTYYDDAVYGVSQQSESATNFGLGASRNTNTKIWANTWNGLNQFTQAKNAYSETTTRFDDSQYGVSLESVSRNNFGLGATRETATNIQANTYNGLNQETVANNYYGTTRTLYDDDHYGVAKESFAENNFGLGASLNTHSQIEANEVNGLNEFTYASNLYSNTLTLYDSEDTGVAVQSLAQNNFGLHASRVTQTNVTANAWNGLNQQTVANSDYGATVTRYDDAVYGVVLESEANNHFGLGATRQTYTEVDANTWNGLNRETIAVNTYGRTFTEYDEDQTGVAERSVADNNFGLGAARHTETIINANTFNGLNVWTVASNDYGWTQTTFDEHDTGVAETSLAQNNFGLKAARLTSTQIDANEVNGLNNSTLATNYYGQTYTVFDNQEFGVARWSMAENNYGLEDARNTYTVIDANTENGLNESTTAINTYSTTYTEFDDTHSGVAVASHASNNFGLKAAAETDTLITANQWNGLNISTDAVNDYGQTLTVYDALDTGIALSSVGLNNFGLEASRYNETAIEANDWNGLNRSTVGINAYSVTRTEYDEHDHGVAERSFTENFFGLLSSRTTETLINANVNNGLNTTTKAVNDYGTTWTWYDDTETGVSETSLAINNFGLLTSRITLTDINANKVNGMNTRTTARNLYGTTTTLYDDEEYGTAVSSLAENEFGLLASRITQTDITTNVWNGLNQTTIADSDYGVTVTNYDDQYYGVAENSDATNNYGLGFTKETHTEIQSNIWNGLNRETVATNIYGETTTIYDEHETGVAQSSESTNNFGLTLTRQSHTTIEASTYNGLNIATVAENAYGITWTEYDSENTGVSERSISLNYFGLGASRLTTTEVNANVFNGLNTSTEAVNAYGSTYTEFDDEDSGTSVYSHSVNNYGLGASKVTDTTIVANLDTGLNEYTVARNNYGTTLTQFDDQVYGVSVASISNNNYGILESRSSATLINANTANGLNESTMAVSNYGTTVTEYDSVETGVSTSSMSMNNYGILASRESVTAVNANTFNGLNKETIATSVYGSTYTNYDDQETGVSEWSLTDNNFGLTSTRSTYTEVQANLENGLNTTTLATSDYGVTQTFFDDQTYGIAVGSVAWNNYGLMSTRETYTFTTANVANGMNTRTFNVNEYGWTETFYDDQTYGVATSSRAHNNFGLGAVRDTETVITASPFNGLNVETTATNSYSTTTTFYDYAATGVAVASQAQNNFGLTKTREVDTVITANLFTGLNIRTTAVSDYSTTKTWYDALDTGVATNSWARNEFGLGAARITTTTVVANAFNGLNESTVAVSDYSTTTTFYESEESGMATHSVGVNNYGIGYTKHTTTTNNSNPWNGLNYATLAENQFSTTLTLYDDQEYGTAQESFSENYFGILAARITHTDILADTASGLNISTLASNDAGSTVTYFDDEYGVSTHSESIQNFGLLASRHTVTSITANTYTGQNDHTIATNGYGTTLSYYRDWGNGTIRNSVANNNFGAVGGRHVETSFTVDGDTGINKKSVSSTALGSTTTHFDPVYGLNTHSVSNNRYGAIDSRRTTTTFTVNPWNGLNVSSEASNRLSTTSTLFGEYGETLQTISDNRRGARFGRHVETVVDASIETGLNIATYSHSILSDSWTEYDSVTGLQTESLAKMNEGITLAYAVWTHNEYEMDEYKGIMSESTATNLMGITYSDYDGNGLIASSDNYGAYGVVWHTHTTYTPNLQTGNNHTSVAVAYSRGNHSKAISSTTSYYDSNNMAWKSVSTASTGANLGKVKTSIITNDPNTGTKRYAETTSGMSTSRSWCDEKGIDIHTISNSDYGPRYGRRTDDWNVNYDSNTGIRRSGYAESDLNQTWSFFDENGLPEQNYQQKRSFYGAAEASRIEHVQAGDIHWSGNPAMTRSTTQISVTDSYFDENGFSRYAWTGNMYGARGDALTRTTYNVNQETGMNNSTWQYKYKSDRTRYGSAKVYSTYDARYGVATYSKNWNKDGDVTETTTGFNRNTGMTTSTTTTGENGYLARGTSYDGHGRKLAGRTKQDKQDGKSTVDSIYTSAYEYNNWTGLVRHETRSNVTNYDGDTDIWYDEHGVENNAWKNKPASAWPGGTQWEFITYSGVSPDGTPTQAAIEHSGPGLGTTMSVTQHNLQIGDMGLTTQHYMPSWEEIVFNYGNYITNATIVYELLPSGPISATVTDNQGTEFWVMDGHYEQSALETRTRVNYDGSTMTWTYTSNPVGPYHTSANISYTNFLGLHTGTGSERYTSTGILTRQTLNNLDTWDETVSFQNDGQYVTTATGTREDGVSTSYSFTGMNEIASSSDDKGVTTWDPTTYRRTSTTGDLGTFTYTYSGARVIAIEGTPASGGTVQMDAYWNVQEWTDSLGVVHQYSPRTTNKGYVTSATETFTDLGGTVWTGTVNYAPTGFYFAGSTLHATNAKLDELGADNTLTMNENAALAAVRSLILKNNMEKETYSWNPPGVTRARKTLGQKKSAELSLNDLTGYADVELTINADGSITATFDYIRFNEAQFTKKTRYKPKSSSRTYKVISNKEENRPATGDTRNMSRLNDPFRAGSVGKVTSITSTKQVEMGKTTERYFVETILDDPDTPENEYQEIEHASQAHDSNGNPLYEMRTREVTLYGTEWTVHEESWYKAQDGWQWVSANTDQLQNYAGGFSTSSYTTAASPFGTEGMDTTAGSNQREYRTSHGNQGVGTELAGNRLYIQPYGSRRVVGAAVANEEPETASPDGLVGRIMSALGRGPKVVDERQSGNTGEEVMSGDAKLAAMVADSMHKAKDVTKDEKGRIVQAVDKRDLTHTFEYQPTGLEQTISYADRVVCVRHYNNDAQLEYENLDGRMRQFTYLEDGGTAIEERAEGGVKTMHFDNKGQLVKLEKEERTITYSYPGTGQGDYTANFVGPTGDPLEERTYRDGRLVTKKTPDGRTTNYDYMMDSDKQVQAVTAKVKDPDGEETTLKYDKTGRLVSITGKHAERFEAAMDGKDTLSEAAFVFELGDDPFADERLEGQRMQEPAVRQIGM